MEHGYTGHESEHQSLKVFDELASIRMLAEDYARYGRALPETRQQVYNEELTFVAEGLNAPLRTQFTLAMSPEGLRDERGTLMQQSLKRGVTAAEHAALADSRLWFNVRRAVHDYHEGELLEAMVRGETNLNTVVSVSPFAEEAYRSYGSDCLESIGMQPDRLLGFIRVYTKTSKGELEVTSLSIDNSDLDAFRVVLQNLGVTIPIATESDDFQAYRAQLSLDTTAQVTLPGQLISSYDETMQGLYGGQFRAGRQSDNDVEAWSFIAAQQDAVEYYLEQLENLAQADPNNRRAKRELTYGFWASLKDRLNDHIKTRGEGIQSGVPIDQVVRNIGMDQEFNQALQRAAARHEKMVGCGGSLGIDDDLLGLSPENALSSIMSDRKENWSWKKGICRVTNCPSPNPTEVGPCKVCKNCQHIFDKGGDPIKRYKNPAPNVAPKLIMTPKLSSEESVKV